MEQSLLPIILSFLGGGTVLAVVNYFINRRKNNTEIGGIQGIQTAKWRDDALHLSESMLDKDKEIHRGLKTVHDLEMERDTLAEKLRICLSHTEDCECKEKKR